MSDVFKCKICGGDLESIGIDIAVCQYCGTKQILPKLNTAKKANLYDRANHYRSINEFDKASAVYEQVLAEDESDAEVYWDLVLCRYGVEYIEDPRTKKRIPTVNRTQFQSIYEDCNYIAAVEHASKEQKDVIEADAEQIDRIQKGILEISSKEQPYDIFICYKEIDDSGRRTPDSVLAQDIYKALVEEGYKVFFSRITLEDKLGSAYEPYIFAALNSSKVMIVVGTKPEYFNAVWVKNEWTRYLGLINAGEKKVLIPAYKDMDPYDLPEEYSHLQAQDMNKLGFMQDLIRGVGKIITPMHLVQPAASNIDVDALKMRIEVFLENGDYNSAREYCDKVLDVRPKDGETYALKLCAEMGVRKISELSKCNRSFENLTSYKNALRFCTAGQKEELESYVNAIRERQNNHRKKFSKLMIIMASIIVVTVALVFIITTVVIPRVKSRQEYNDAKNLLKNQEYDKAYEAFETLGDYKNSTEMMQEVRYQEALDYLNNGQSDKAIYILTGIIDYSDSASKIQEIYDMKYQEQYDEISSLVNAKDYDEATRIIDQIEKNEGKVEQLSAYRALITAGKYNEAKELYEKEEFNSAKKLFAELGEYEDSATYVKECDYMSISQYYKQSMYLSVINSVIMYEMYDYKDCARLFKESAEFIGSNNYSYSSRVREYNKNVIGKSDYQVSVIESLSEGNLQPEDIIKKAHTHYFHIMVDGGEIGDKKELAYYISIGQDVFSDTVSVENGECVDCSIDVGLDYPDSSYALVIDGENNVYAYFVKEYK